MKTCECGCGHVVNPDYRFLVGHHRRRYPRGYEIDNETGCWEWLGSCNRRGYGRWYEGGEVLAHRYFYEQHVGPIPEGMCVCHRCDNPKCVNPDHLFLGTHRDNMEDCVRKGRQATGERNGQAKLTTAMVREIRERAAHGESGSSLGRSYGVRQTSIWKIVNGQHWRGIEDLGDLA